MSYDYPEAQIRKRTKIALGVFQKNDSFLIEINVNERSIAHKLAEYLQEQFPDWNVDCEYNRHYLDTKRLEGVEECEEHSRTDKVYPDITIHERNKKHNLLVIELKKNAPRCQCDIRKLELFTKKGDAYGYTLGLYIQFDNSLPKLKWFKDGKQIDCESQ